MHLHNVYVNIYGHVCLLYISLHTCASLLCKQVRVSERAFDKANSAVHVRGRRMHVLAGDVTQRVCQQHKR